MLTLIIGHIFYNKKIQMWKVTSEKLYKRIIIDVDKTFIDGISI